ncbi:Meiosis-specific protein ASY1 [Camellia lanceoleosa]|nr:Meiosis-specific protein ASY1 [Camellia lanceoleosa]
MQDITSVSTLVNTSGTLVLHWGVLGPLDFKGGRVEVLAGFLSGVLGSFVLPCFVVLLICSCCDVCVLAAVMLRVNSLVCFFFVMPRVNLGNFFGVFLCGKEISSLEVKSMLDPCEDENDDIQDDDVSLGADFVQRDENSESISSRIVMTMVDMVDEGDNNP